MRQDQVEEVLKRLRKEISSVSSSSLMRAFQSVDKDKNGYLEAPEFAKCLGQFKITLPPAALPPAHEQSHHVHVGAYPLVAP